MKRKVNDNGMPPGHPNPPAPGVDLDSAIRAAQEDLRYADAERNKRLGLNCFTSKSPWFRGGNDENQS